MRHNSVRWFGAIVLTLALAGTASAQDAAVAAFSGPRAAGLRAQVIRGLEAGGVSVTSDESRAVAMIEGRVSRRGRRYAAELRAVDREGREIATFEESARRVNGLNGAARDWAQSQVAPRVSEMSPPAEASAPRRAAPAREELAQDDEREDARDEEDDDDADSSAAASTSVRAPLTVSAGAALMNRTFTYNDDLYAMHSPYELPVAPVALVGLEWAPFAHMPSTGALGQLSLVVDGEVALEVRTVDGNGTPYPTELWTLAAGLRYRVPVDDVQFYFDAGYRAYVFTLRDASADQPRPEVPNIEAHGLRGGVGFLWHMGSGLMFLSDFSYIHPVALGEIASADWFPHASAGGVEGRSGFALRVDDVEFRTYFLGRRYFYAMNPVPGDARVVGGAIDQSLGGVLEFAWTPSQLRP